MPEYSFDHLHLTSTDPVKTASFYEEMFKAKRVALRQTPDGRTSVDLDIKGVKILVVQRPPGAKEQSIAYGLDHFGLRTTNIEASVAELKAKGVEFRDEIRTARPGLRIAFLWAPEKVLIELLEY